MRVAWRAWRDVRLCVRVRGVTCACACVCVACRAPVRACAWRDVRLCVACVQPDLRITYPHIGYEDGRTQGENACSHRALDNVK